ncbi:MAG TPA: VOC family protein [Spirochaetota bacterium]|nr:VOC family protein [Spirochaetota bacterium]HPS85668.1 VOC family protein [Spirochaetota bacterium]
MKKITPCLWFDGKAEEAANFYVSIFNDSKIVNISRYGKDGAKASGMPEGSVMTVKFQIDGEEFLALNGGPQFTFSPAVSFIANCGTQEEIDHLWEKLSEGGAKEVCGWLRDKYGISWQIVPAVLEELISDPDPVVSERVMRAMLQMKKLDIRALENAYNG